MVDLVTLQATAYVAQIVGVVGTLTAARAALEFGFIEQFEEGRKKPYKLTEIGIKFLELMGGS